MKKVIQLISKNRTKFFQLILFPVACGLTLYFYDWKLLLIINLFGWSLNLQQKDMLVGILRKALESSRGVK